MKKHNFEKALTNRAELQESENIACNNCSEPVIFHLKDNTHEFTMNLTTVLECLAFAIQTGELPKLPFGWISEVDRVLDTDYADDDRITCSNSEFMRKRE